MTYILGKGLVFRGELTGEGDIQVQGHMEGKIAVTGTVSIPKGASIQADISATEIIVAGVVRGNLMGSGKVEVLPTAQLEGDTRSKSLVVAQGAVVTGRFSVGPPPSPVEVFAEMEQLLKQEEARDR